MRVIESEDGPSGVWLPNYRSRRYALIAGMSLVPPLLISAVLIIERPGVLSAVLVVALVLLTVFPGLKTLLGNGLLVTDDLVLKGSPRRPAQKVRRADVVLVRYRGEYGELIGSDGQVLLEISRLLTRRQVGEVADYLHVPFSGPSSTAPVADTGDVPGVYVLRPDRRKVLTYGSIAGLFVAGGIGVSVMELGKHNWATAIFLAVAYTAFAAIVVVWLRINVFVVAGDAVYKGSRNRGRYAARSEIAAVGYGPGLSLLAANGSRLLSVDGSVFTPAQAKELAVRLDVPLRSGALKRPRG